MKKYTIEEIRNYILSQDSLGDVLYNLSEENIDKVNDVKFKDYSEDEDNYIDLDSIRLECTCHACPEQYNAYKGDEYVGYLRLRHGYFYTDDKDGNTIYESNTIGDGIFDSEERELHLNNAKRAIIKSLSN